MKYIVTLRDKTYEVEVEHGEAMVVDEYLAKAPAGSAPSPAAPAVPAAPATAPQVPAAEVAAGTPIPAPLPGNVLSIAKQVGAPVKAGDVVMVIEAMKMENEITAPVDGVVKQILVAKGQIVATGDVLAVI